MTTETRVETRADTSEEKQKPATYHDSGYKRLFSNKTIFRQLIETFVEEDWVSRLDFEQAERLETSFVSEHYKRDRGRYYLQSADS